MTGGLLTASAALLGGMAGCVLSCVPGLHVYNIIGGLLLVVPVWGVSLPPDLILPLFLGLVVGFSMGNTVPAVLVAAPDESAMFTVLPGQKFLMEGRGREAVLLTAVGGLAGLFVLVLVLGPLGPRVLPLCKAVLLPHGHWVLWCVIAFMLMSEWSKEGRLGQAGWSKLGRAWSTLGAGLATFALSGLLGFVLLYRSPISAGVAFQNLMPAFVGLFTIPSLLLNAVSGVKVPQQRGGGERLPFGAVAKGVVAGALGGGFAAFFPVVTGGIGGMLAGHATAVRDDRTFLVSQGASKVVYYVGGFLLFFVPGVELTRGGAAWMMRGVFHADLPADYWRALAVVAFAGLASFLLVDPMARLTLRVLDRVGCRRLSVGSLVFMVVLVGVVTGAAGLLVCAVAAGIGLLPLLWGSRRMNCLAVILLPMACNMSGVGEGIAKLMGLI